VTKTVAPTEFSLTPAELHAIEDHKYFLSQERGQEVSIEEAIGDFLRRYAERWRREKQRRDNRAQLEEIERHKFLRSTAEGRDLGAAAAEEWCATYAKIWREEHESLERNGFRRLAITVRNAAGMHLRPWSRAARLAAAYDCDVYVHRPGMEVWNFLLEGRPFMNVKSVLAVLSLGTLMGDTLEFIATGREADAALDALRELIERECESPVT
jgi:phosphotransferase system HPr (HPr) family protein